MTSSLQTDLTRKKYFALIPAAGVGARMGGATPKQYLTIHGESILRYAVQAFLASPLIQHVYVVVSAYDVYVEDALQGLGDVGNKVGNKVDKKLSILRCGSATRRETVRNGLASLQAAVDPDDWILVHDAARPGLTPEMIAQLIAQVGEHASGGLLALPVVDTVKRVTEGKVATIARDGLWLAQTPQMFRHAALSAALDAAGEVTDESSAMEAAGHEPLMVEGHPRNLKVTLPSDLALVQSYLSKTSG
ncbi:2-C-methyl-D-erythritol 4-phosphate cytidylyltransferase [Undibacterium sp. Jales W-56]|uniref:2-C-methyl-D-erythritol 4-phosphate cytidylyltransferase n=1 Tax=Undibacterium sp. Jales W-56 TaxID=2897325 RepID=UPI0021D2D623|nr:2-C-methyl-D-erythritol 4-phosphate cytidylyltransferase [Undibacterium sp. Jales W-56]MCU6433665.1 2-C-methyl-D-erythritol 4-phosphate cytidylyltransferase [Undibacterium sp. Jales W-56]